MIELGPAVLYNGETRDVMRRLVAEGVQVDSVVTDPPYEIGFMGRSWDSKGVAFDPETWRLALQLLKPGGHLLAFSGARTYHRMAVAIEDAGFEIRDQIQWIYASGFPKGRDVAWEIHKNACLACGPMVASDHEKIKHDKIGNEIPSNKAAGKEPETEHYLRFVRATYLSTPVYACEKCGQVLQPFMSESETQALRSAWNESKAIWTEQPRLEGGSNVEETERELQRCEVCTLSHGIFADGAEGRLHNGTPPSYGAPPWQVAEPDGSRPSYRPQSREQLLNQPNAFFLERRAQAYRGFNVALKPAHEPLVLARKPLCGTVAATVLEHGTGALNIDGCRVETKDALSFGSRQIGDGNKYNPISADRMTPGQQSALGRFPANLIHDGSPDVLAAFPSAPGQLATAATGTDRRKTQNVYGAMQRGSNGAEPRDDLDKSAARFFYCAKASKADRGPGNDHPTVKPRALMRYLCRLITPPGGVTLDLFAGSGSTALGAVDEGFRPILIEEDEHNFNIACGRIAQAVMEANNAA